VDYVLLVVPQATLRTLEDTPTRSLTELAKRLGVAESEATAPPTLVEPPALASTFPLLAAMGLNGTSSVPRIRLSRRAVIAARKQAIR
jgi:hypothetical protein